MKTLTYINVLLTFQYDYSISDIFGLFKINWNINIVFKLHIKLNVLLSK